MKLTFLLLLTVSSEVESAAVKDHSKPRDHKGDMFFDRFHKLPFYLNFTF